VRLRAAIGVAVAVALVVTSPTAEAKSKPCTRKGSHTIVATKSVRVYRVENSDGNFDLYGCLRSDGKRQKLQHGYDDMIETSGTFDRVHVAGHYVAWQFTAYDVSCKTACPPDYNSTVVTLRVRDLKKRKTVNVRGEVASGGRLVLTTGGAIAWTQQGVGSAVAVLAYDGTGRRQLDSGQVPPGSLYLSGRIAHWTNAGAPKQASLSPR
jgi:hypothetical protein